MFVINLLIISNLIIQGSKSRFILDKFHLNKHIIQATSHLEDIAESSRQAICDSFSFEDKEYCKQIFEDILSITGKETKRKAVLRSRDYIMNQWDEIIIKNEDTDARMIVSMQK